MNMTIIMIIVFFNVNNISRAIYVGSIHNAALTLIPSPNRTLNRSTCNECLCTMLMAAENSSIVSLNCYMMGTNSVVCQLFTTANYQISSFNQIESNVNSTFYFLQLPSNNQAAVTTANTVETTKGTTDSITTKELIVSTMKSVRTMTTITRAGDSIVGLYNTTAGRSTGGKNGMFSTSAEYPDKAIDNLTSTKYLNFGVTGGYNIVANAPGVGTGFYVTPAISNNSIAIGLRFATGNDSPNRDPISVTLEGCNSNALDAGSSWTLIYNGSTGISATVDPGRMQYVPQQNFSNIIAYKSYRLLITSQRGPEWAVQYSEAAIIGYV